MDSKDLQINCLKIGKPVACFLFFLVCWSNVTLANGNLQSSLVSNAESSAQLALPYEVLVSDSQGKPVKNVVVEFHSTTQTTQLTDKIATMDQIDQQFRPHILVIEKGTLVSFPNSDNIKHQIYSFSKAKSFEQGLYEQMQATPIKFETSGTVDLGCNIHDWMLGYIYVADSHYFAKTNDKGKVELSIPISIDSVSIWHPRMREDDKRPVTIAKDNQTHFTFQLKNPMSEDTEGYEDLSLDVY